MSARKVYIPASITLSREVAVHLHALAKDDEVSRALILPKTGTTCTAASSLFVDDQGGVSLSCNIGELLHEGIARNVATLRICWLDNDCGNWGRLVLFRRDGLADTLQNLTFSCSAIRVLDAGPAKLQRHAWVSKLSQHKGVSVVTAFESEGCEPRIGSSLPHSLENGMLNSTVGAAESHIG